MKTLKLMLLFIMLGVGADVAAQDQNWGVGVRLGDPSGLTLKKYNKKTALELSIGRTFYGLYRNGYYDRRFNDWYPDQRLGYSEFQYVGYRGQYAPIAIQLHYLFRNKIAKLDGLEWYAGFGAQFRFHNYTFDYRYKVQGDPRWYYATGSRTTDIDLGLDGVIGMEYFFKEVPISVFVDMNLFMEVADDPFLFHFQAGAGGRFLF